MNRILITGASGLLGANLALDYRTWGYEVTACHHRHPVEFDGVDSVSVDITSPTALEKVLQASRPNWIIHCAARTNVDECELDPAGTRALNVEATRVIARAARRLSAGLIYISTDSVFDGRRGGYQEEDAPFPLNEYARSKLAGEMAARIEFPGVTVVRTNIYGWNVQPKLSLAEWVLTRLEAGEEVPGFEDVSFSPILVNHLGEILREMMRQCLRGTYHVAGGEGVSKYEFARRVAEVFGLDERLIKPTRIEESSLRAPRPRNTTLDVGRIERATGRKMPDVMTGLRRFRSLRDDGLVDRLRIKQGDISNGIV